MYVLRATKAFQLITAATSVDTSVRPCIRVHVIQNNHPLFGDGMILQIFDNNKCCWVQNVRHGGCRGDTSGILTMNRVTRSKRSALYNGE